MRIWKKFWKSRQILCCRRERARHAQLIRLYYSQQCGRTLRWTIRKLGNILYILLVILKSHKVSYQKIFSTARHVWWIQVRHTGIPNVWSHFGKIHVIGFTIKWTLWSIRRSSVIATYIDWKLVIVFVADCFNWHWQMYYLTIRQRVRVVYDEI